MNRNELLEALESRRQVLSRKHGQKPFFTGEEEWLDHLIARLKAEPEPSEGWLDAEYGLEGRCDDDGQDEDHFRIYVNRSEEATVPVAIVARKEVSE